MKHPSEPTSARDAVIQRIRAALRDVPTDAAAITIPRAYRQTDPAPREEIVARFIERVREYKAVVQETTLAALPQTIAAACARRNVQQLAVPADLPTVWLPMGITPLRDAPPLSHAQLNACDGVLTACVLGIAQTGTIVLDGGPYQGRRALSLIPDYHLCVVRAEQIVGIVPEAIQALTARATQPITFISGPSATSDIELNRVEGVHGPRILEILVIR